MAHPAGQLPQHGQFLLADQLLLGILQLPRALHYIEGQADVVIPQGFLCLLALGNIRPGANNFARHIIHIAQQAMFIMQPDDPAILAQEMVFVLIKIIEQVLQRSLNGLTVFRMNLSQPPCGLHGSFSTEAQHGLDVFADPYGSGLIACHLESIDDRRAVCKHVSQAFGGFAQKFFGLLLWAYIL